MIKERNGVRSLSVPFILSTAVMVFGALYIYINFDFLPTQIGLFFTKPWGQAQLTDPKNILLLPAISVLFLLVSSIISLKFLTLKRPNHAKTLMIFTLISIVFITYSSVLIIFRSTTKLFYLNFESLQLIPPWVLAFAATYAVTPKIIAFAKRKNLVDDPKKHKHPAQLLTKTTPRAGALAFFIGFLIPALLILPITKALMGIYLGAGILIITGLIDDRKDINPKLRLILQIAGAGAVVGSGVGISYITNPFGSTILLDRVVIPINVFGNHSIVLFADLFAFVWLIFLANAVSWSNGIDGQFSGFIGMTALMIALISIKTGVSDNDPTQLTVAVLAVVVSGAAIGLTPYTWYPQKILWGFGATAVGLIIGALSILSLSKVYTVFLVLLIPLTDALFTGARRILKRQSPFRGDMMHLHHRLLALGWSKPKIAFLYWVLTLAFGIVAVVSDENDVNIDVIRYGVLATIALIIINLGVGKNKLPKLKLVLKSLPKKKRKIGGASGRKLPT